MDSLWTRRIVVAVCLAVLVVCGMLLYRLYDRSFDSGGIWGNNQALIGGPFELTDQNGNAVTDQTFKGKLMLIYFGYTYCPDACPTALGVMSAALDKLDVAADRVVPMLITVDPERDTQQVLKEYVSAFGPRMMGLTGTPEQVAKAAKAYRVFYQKQPGKDPKDYMMDHTVLIYLMDGDGKYVTHFGPDATPDQLAEEIRKHL